uniref:EGF-like domain-containing protein n=1 Tax=Panagrolaimus sp. JU765 TaxID=591449 RepID=A0AC34QKL2_9BILA
MKFSSVLLITLIIGIFVNFGDSAGWSFLRNQAACKVKCQNNGVCLYKIGHREIHSCRCYDGMFEGDLCQYKVTPSTPTQRILITTSTKGYSIEEVEVDSHDEDQLISAEELSQKIVSLENPEYFDKGKSDYVAQQYQENDQEQTSQQEDDNEQEAVSTENQPNLDNPPQYFEPDTQVDQYRQSSKTTHSVERDSGETTGEEEDGWMMVKKTGNNASAKMFNLIFLFSYLFIKFAL